LEVLYDSKNGQNYLVCLASYQEGQEIWYIWYIRKKESGGCLTTEVKGKMSTLALSAEDSKQE